MKRYLYYIIVFLGVLFLSTSCEEEAKLEETGYLSLSLDKDLSVVTKANISISDEPLSVEIKNAQGEVVKKYDNFYSEVSGSRIVLPSGSYTVQAYSCKDLKKAGFSQAYYASPITSVTIAAGEVQTLKLTCTLANTKVSVEYTEAVRKYFKKYQAEISNIYGSILFSETEKRAGYMASEPLSVRLDLINNTDQSFMVKKEIADVKPRDYFKFRFDVQASPEDEAGADFNIIIEAMDADTTFVLKLPITDSSYGKAKPTFEGEEWPSFEEGKGTDILQKIHSDVGLRSLVLELPEAIQIMTGLSPKIDLAEASESDLLRLRISLSAKVKDAKDLTVDFSDLTKALSSESLETKYPIAITAIDTLGQATQIERTFWIKPNGIYAMEVNAFAHFAYLVGGDFLSTPSSTFGFKYCKKGTANWKEVTEGIERDPNTNLFTVRVDGLEAGAEYEFIAYTNQGEGKGEFITEAETQLPNAGFELWSLVGETWYPEAMDKAGNTTSFWNTSNPGTSQGIGALGGAVNPTMGVTSPVYSGQFAAKLQSTSKLGVFAAASLYTGGFLGLEGMSANMEFGKPFTSRPKALCGYYKYTPAVINNVDRIPDGVTIVEDETMDECAIFIALAKKSFTFNNGKEDEYIQYETDPNIIAYGELPLGEATSADGYVKFNIPLKYKNLTDKPMYIIVVCSASKYGDYMTGGEGSTLYIDDISLDYEGEPILWK